jgi:hypothetical protein
VLPDDPGVGSVDRTAIGADTRSAPRPARTPKANTWPTVEAMPQAHVPRNGSRAPGGFDDGSRRARSRTDEGELTDPSSCRAVLRRRGLACGLCPNLGPPLRSGLAPRAAVTRIERLADACGLTVSESRYERQAPALAGAPGRFNGLRPSRVRVPPSPLANLKCLQARLIDE